MVKTVILVACGGACGAVARYCVVSLLSGSGAFPWGTLVANLIGSFAVGTLVGSVWDTPWFHDYGRAFLVFGLLGAFTTFSAFSLDAFRLYEAGRVAAAAGYVAGSVFVSIAALIAGISIARAVFA